MIRITFWSLVAFFAFIHIFRNELAFFFYTEIFPRFF